MEFKERIALRLPKGLRTDLEKERRRMSTAAGAEISASAVIRAIIERDLHGKRRSGRGRGATA